MWSRNEVLYPRFLRSLLWIIFLQYALVSTCLLIFKWMSWSPLSNTGDWILCSFHWRTNLHFVVLSASIAAFAILNMQYFAVEKHINSTRFEIICSSPYCLQHILSTMALGGLTAYSYDSLLHNFQDKSAFIFSWLTSSNDFEQSFIIGYGCFTGLMFSLKYFICNMYLVKFSLDQDLKIYGVIYQMPDLLKESFFCVVKSIHWYYLIYLIFGSPLKFLTFYYYNFHSDEGILSIIVNVKLFFICIITGVAIFYMWSLYLSIFNALATETYKFPITLPIKSDKLTLSNALACKDSDYLKYLAALDLRFLSQYEPKRREQIFAISHPGGHPHEWKAVSGVCISLLQEFVYKLNEYSFAAAAAPESKITAPKISKVLKESISINNVVNRPAQSLTEKVFCYLRKKPAVSYFFDEFPNAKLMKLFASSQPFTWIVDAFGYLVTVSYHEDKYGVVQQTLPEIIRLLLDIKMAEEKMPVGLVGIRTYVKDPQGRYDHIHQRLSLKTTVNNALSKIASTFNENINGICLPEEYQKYFERYLDKKN